MQYVIVGLGNPGEEYARSRHNAGRMAVAHFAEKAGAEPWKTNVLAKAQVAKIPGVATLVLPDTFMNKSGSAVGKFVKSVAAAKRLVVIYDDLDLPIGKIKFSFGRGSGGHKGVESIARALKTKDFIRIRIGVSKRTAKGIAKKVSGEDEVIDFVLGTFRKAEMEQMEEVFDRIEGALKVILEEGHERAMNRYN